MSNKGKLVLRQAENLIPGEKVVVAGILWIIGKNIDRNSAMKQHPLQFHIEWETQLNKYGPDLYAVDSLPLSFDQYQMALEIGEGNEVEFEIKKTAIPNKGFLFPETKIEFAKIIPKEEEHEEDVIDYWVSKKKLMEKEKKEKIMVVDDEGYIVRTVDYMLNNFANYLLTNNIKLRDSNQIAQVIIDYLKQME